MKYKSATAKYTGKVSMLKSWELTIDLKEAQELDATKKKALKAIVLKQAIKAIPEIEAFTEGAKIDPKKFKVVLNKA